MLVNPNNKKFSWSPSAINDFQTCPRQYSARRFYETLPWVETEAMRAGTIEHKHLEDRLKKKTPLPDGFTRGEKYCLAFEKSGIVKAEQKMAINKDLKPVGWFAKDAWGRCVIDVSVVSGTRLALYDWKTGNIRENSLQLKINACIASLVAKEIEEYVTRYIWLKHDAVTPHDGNFRIEEIPRLWEEILTVVGQMEDAWKTETFNPKPSGLCRNWCDVRSCEFCGKK